MEHLQELQNLAESYRIPVFNSLIPQYVPEIAGDRLRSVAKLYPNVNSLAGFSVYVNGIFPYLERGQDAKLLPETVNTSVQVLSNKMASGERAQAYMYYAASHLLGPERTGAITGALTFSELELARKMLQISVDTAHLGVPLDWVVVNESRVLNKELGIDPNVVAQNETDFSNFAKQTTGNSIQMGFRGLEEDLHVMLNGTYKSTYQNQKQAIMAETDMGNHRMQALLASLPEHKLSEFGGASDSLQQTLLGMVSHFDALMGMRSVAKQALVDGKVNMAECPPQFRPDNLSIGLVRASSRMVLQLPKMHGKSVFPNHGIACYRDDGTYRGNYPYNLLRQKGAKIIEHQGEPQFALVN